MRLEKVSLDSSELSFKLQVVESEIELIAEGLEMLARHLAKGADGGLSTSDSYRWERRMETCQFLANYLTRELEKNRW
jgi:hypothetical protein